MCTVQANKNSIQQKHRATRLLQILHTDVCGPVDTESWRGKKYILTVMDDFSHFVVTYFLRTGVKLLATSRKLFYNIKVSKIRCDNGGEYSRHEFRM